MPLPYTNTHECPLHEPSLTPELPSSPLEPPQLDDILDPYTVVHDEDVIWRHWPAQSMRL